MHLTEGHFDGHGGAPVPYGANLPMQHDQDFAGHFDGRGGDAAAQYRSHHLMEEVRGFHKSH